MVILRIWHGVRHDDAMVTEVSEGIESREAALAVIDRMVKTGFFVHREDDKTVVVPWAKVNYLEIIETDDER